MHLQQYLQDLDLSPQVYHQQRGKCLLRMCAMPDFLGEPALTGADGLVLRTGTDRPTLNCVYEPVLASTDEPAFIGTDGPTPTSNSGPVILHQRYQ